VLIERVTVIKSARIGYTTILVGALANYVHNDPSSLMCLLPVKDDARNFVVSQPVSN
jgi:phage terminase large subunit GpA-like protein